MTLRLLLRCLLCLLFAGGALAARAQSGCDPRQAVAFSDGSRVCLHERSGLPWPSDRRDWRPAFNGMYSVAASAGTAACPLALGVGTNINSAHSWYAEKRDQTALQQCSTELRQRGGAADCACQLLIKDGVAYVEREEFEALLSGSAPAQAAAAPAPGLQQPLPEPVAPAAVQAAASAPPSPPTAASAAPSLPGPVVSAALGPAAPARVDRRRESPPPRAAAAAVPSSPAALPEPAAVAVAAPVPPAAPAPPPLPPRRALVIGNRDYVVGQLKNPVNDARAMEQMLRRLGFITTLVLNLRREDIGSTIDAFTASVQPGDDVVLFYAGHGLQIRGMNYLPAVDARIRTESDVPLNSIHLNQVLERLDEAKAGVRLLLVDACRDNPYSRSYRSGLQGLARIDAAPAGTLIHFATRPGGLSADGDGDHGLYTKHLLQHLPTVGLPVEQMLKRVASAVRRESANEQLPWTEGSLDGEFYFAPPK